MRNSKGFTLVELAVVLVIIGIILGAVIKGQDLIDNARAKQFTNNLKTWQIAVTAYFDRKGRYPGDSDKNGIIADEATPGNPQDDLTKAKFVSLPTDSAGNTINNFVMGQNTYYVLFGNDGGSPAKNTISVCVKDDCTGVFNSEALKMAESFNTAIAGSADAKGTSVYGVTGFSTVTKANWMAKPDTTKIAGNSDWLQNTTVTGLVYVIQ